MRHPDGTCRDACHARDGDPGPDVAAELKELARQRGVSFREVLNEAVRAGLAAGTTPRSHRLPTARLGLRPGVNLDGALRLAAAMEDEETARELELRK